MVLCLKKHGFQDRPKALFILGVPIIFGSIRLFGSRVDFWGLLLFRFFHFGSTEFGSSEKIDRTFIEFERIQDYRPIKQCYIKASE